MPANIYSWIFVGVSSAFLGYSFLKYNYPGRGLKVITNLFKETIPFEMAIKALKEGKRVRRKSKRRGYTKVVLTAGKFQSEKVGSYWVDDDKDVDDHCSFSMEDVLANDWLIEE
jgi:hypothetical protein